MNIIGISGLAGSGKDTAADMLLENKGFIKLSFADPIKRLAKDLWDFSDDQLWGPSELRSEVDPRYGLSPRQVLQHLGTEGARALDPDVWVRYAIKVSKLLMQDTTYKGDYTDYSYTIKGGLIKSPFKHDRDWIPHTSPSGIVIADVRFVNEVQHIRKNKGKVIRVVRAGSGLDGDFGMHQSEMEMSEISDDEFDLVINNDGDLSDLKRSVNEFVSMIS